MMKKVFYMLTVLTASICCNGCFEDDSDNSNPTVVVEILENSSSSSNEQLSSSSQNTSSSSKEELSSSSSNQQLSSSSQNTSSSSSEKLSSSSSNKQISSSSQNTSSSSKEELSSSSSNQQLSSSSQNTSSSSREEQSSSSSNKQFSSSSQNKSSSSVAESSSSNESISSSSVEQLIPSKLYDCDQYKCLPTQYLNPEIEYGELLDARDKQVYRTVKIGDQVWMAQNLNYDIGDTTTDKRFVYKYSTKVLPYVEDSLAKYGRGYTWVQALDTTEACDTNSCYFQDFEFPHRGICPEGWHIPSEREWKLLEKYVALHNDDEGVGVSLKVKDVWRPYADVPLGTNRFGFSALPFDPLINDDYPLARVYFWTTSQNANYVSSANVFLLVNASTALSKESAGKSQRIAVRCLQD
jgi:uncharacterized protein (TIGR02145 family)